MNTERDKKFEKVKAVGVYCTLSLWFAGYVSFFYFHQSGWWFFASLVAGWALYYPFIRGYLERKYFSD